MSGQAGYFLAMGLGAMALGVVAVALVAAGYYGELESGLRSARRRLAAMEAGALEEPGYQAGEAPEGDGGPYPAEEGQGL